MIPDENAPGAFPFFTVEPDGDGQKVTVPLSGGFVLVKTISPDGSRFTIRLTRP